jgi:hypothetical protein
MTKLHDDWVGNLADDCFLERYGMHAHVEYMDRGIWWFAVYRGQECLYNTADNAAAVRLTNGKMARAAAECCMEVLRQLTPNADF